MLTEGKYRSNRKSRVSDARRPVRPPPAPEGTDTMDNELERVERLQKVDISPGDILIVYVDYGKLPSDKREAYAENILTYYKKALHRSALKDVNIILAPNTFDHAVLHIVEEHI